MANDKGRTWLPVVGYEGLYQVSSDGHVRSVKTGHRRELSTKHNRFTGYDAVDLRRDGECKTVSVHRLVATAFIPNPDDLPEVNHIDEDKTNNRVENLEWVTSSQNNFHSSYKRWKRVEARSVDGRLIATFESVDIAAEMLGVPKSCISNALRGRTGTCAGLVLGYAERR